MDRSEPGWEEEEYVNVGEAAHLLGVGRRRITQLIASGQLPATPSLIDRRQRLIRREDLERLLQRYTPIDAETARTFIHQRKVFGRTTSRTHCTFCGRPRTQARLLLSPAPGRAICDTCIEAFYDAWQGEKERRGWTGSAAPGRRRSG